MYHIVSYIFQGDALQRGIKQEWLNVLDIDYIDVSQSRHYWNPSTAHIIITRHCSYMWCLSVEQHVMWAGLQCHRVEADRLCESLQLKAFGTLTNTAATTTTRPPTGVEEDKEGEKPESDKPPVGQVVTTSNPRTRFATVPQVRRSAPGHDCLCL